MSPVLSPADKYKLIESFVKFHEGFTVIRKILIANNGIAALKGMRSIKQWAYEMFGDDKLFEFIVMASPEDVEANAEYIRIADSHIIVPGGKNKLNYANIDLIVKVAHEKKVNVSY